MQQELVTIRDGKVADVLCTYLSPSRTCSPHLREKIKLKIYDFCYYVQISHIVTLFVRASCGCFITSRVCGRGNVFVVMCVCVCLSVWAITFE